MKPHKKRCGNVIILLTILITSQKICCFTENRCRKTFLTNCVAKELLDHGYSVIYFTAFQLFDILSKGVFEKDADAIATHQNIFDCDLLIIDDLGTELSNSFTTSQLFLCLMNVS